MSLLISDKILRDLETRLQYAKDFKPDKVDYYKKCISKRKDELFEQSFFKF